MSDTAKKKGKLARLMERNRRSGGYYLRREVSKRVVSVLRALLLFGLCFMIIQPLLTRLATSVMPEKDLYDSTIVLLPRHITGDNYVLAAQLTDFPNSMFKTLWVSLLVAFCQVVACTLVGYGFARYDFPLKNFWFACVVMVIIVPPQTIAPSLYVFFASFDLFGLMGLVSKFSDWISSVVPFINWHVDPVLNLRGNVVPYVLMSLTCMGLKDGLYIYMLRQYFKGVPMSLEEAAYVDGCGTLHTFVKVMLPDALPIITSCFLFAFVWQWTDLFYTRNFLSTLHPFAELLSSMVDRMSRVLSPDPNHPMPIPAGRQQQMISIGVLMCSAPLILLYCFAQRTFVESLAMTGTKM